MIIELLALAWAPRCSNCTFIANSRTYSLVATSWAAILQFKRAAATMQNILLASPPNACMASEVGSGPMQPHIFWKTLLPKRPMVCLQKSARATTRDWLIGSEDHNILSQAWDHDERRGSSQKTAEPSNLPCTRLICLPETFNLKTVVYFSALDQKFLA